MNPFNKGNEDKTTVKLVDGAEAADEGAGKGKKKGRGKAKAEKKPRGPQDRRRRLSIMCGALAAVSVGAVGFGAVAYSQATAMDAELRGDMVSVVTVKEAVTEGSVIEESNLQATEVPSKYVPTDAAKKAKQLAGKTALADLTAGVPVSLGTVEASDDPANIATAITAGHVAKMISMDTAAGMSPLLAPGDIVTLTAYSDSGSGVSAPVKYEHVRILAVDARLSGGAGEDYATVTVELTPEEADALTGMSVSITAESASDNGGLTGKGTVGEDGDTASDDAEAAEGAENDA